MSRKERVRCPICGARVKEEHLSKHYETMHPGKVVGAQSFAIRLLLPLLIASITTGMVAAIHILTSLWTAHNPVPRPDYLSFLLLITFSVAFSICFFTQS